MKFTNSSRVAVGRITMVVVIVIIVALASAGIIYLKSSTSPAQTVANVTVGSVSPTAGDWPLYIAQYEGFFTKNGLNVTFIPNLGGGTQTASALASGQVHIATLDISSLIPARLSGIKIIEIGQMLRENTYYLVTAPGITSASQLKGKTGGVITVGAGLAYITTYTMLKQLGLDPTKDVNLIGIQGGELTRLQAIKSGRIDFTLTSSSDVPRSMGLNVLFFLPDKIEGVAADGYAVTDSYLASNRDVVKRFMQAVSEANKYFYDNRTGSIQDLRRVLALNNQTLLNTTYVDVSKVMLQIPAVPESTAVDVLNVIRTFDSKAASANPCSFLDNSVVNELIQSGFYSRLWGSSLTQSTSVVTSTSCG